MNVYLVNGENSMLLENMLILKKLPVHLDSYKLQVQRVFPPQVIYIALEFQKYFETVQFIPILLCLPSIRLDIVAKDNPCVEAILEIKWQEKNLVNVFKFDGRSRDVEIQSEIRYLFSKILN